jgi:Coenzyme PQQ synthesis protein D (PqqD)
LSTERTAQVVDRILSARASLPEHMVFRSFVSETVILNLHTGKYHGTNAVGGVMLEALDQSPTVRTAAQALTERFDKSADELEGDLVDFCLDLQERGLIVLDEDQAA